MTDVGLFAGSPLNGRPPLSVDDRRQDIVYMDCVYKCMRPKLRDVGDVTLRHEGASEP